MTNEDVPRDKCGQPIVVGSYIVYGSALGRCAALRLGRVLAVRKIVPTRCPWRILVQGIDDTYTSAQLCAKKGTLMFPTRILVLPPETLTTEQYALLTP